MKIFKRSNILIFVFCAFVMAHCLPLRAAGPITHAFLTEHLFNFYPQYNEEEKIAFRSGTLFSGVRNLGVLTDDAVCFPDVTLNEILSHPSSFIAGMMFHAYVDNLRNAFVAAGSYCDLLNDLEIVHKDLYLKFLEDQILFDLVEKTDWKVCVNNIHPGECMWGINEEILAKWHFLLDMSFSYQPSTLIFLANIKGNGLLNVPADEVSLWNNSFDGVSARSEIGDYIISLFNMFASEMAP